MEGALLRGAHLNMPLQHRQGEAEAGVPLRRALQQIACADEDECVIHRAVCRLVVNREIVAMARGREKDRKVRKKHRKNIKRVKGLEKARRAKKAKR